KERTGLGNRRLSPADFLADKIDAREITPQTANIDPATASAVVTCVRTGAILAAVNYPTFDGNNFLPHRIDAEYIRALNNDPTEPQNNRAFSETNAPGSTFKMVTALAGLSQEIITPTTRIRDNVVFRDAGYPPLHCNAAHGVINVVDAIAASCNYFFNRVAFNMGNRRNGRTAEGIETLNYYMMALGFGQPTGVEISERSSVVGANNVPRLASPTFKEHVRGQAWFDGDTSQASIGQGFVDHTPAEMAKYFATLATGGIRHQMHFLQHRENAAGEITAFTPVVEYTLEIYPAHLEAIHRGMHDAAFGRRGTGRNIFAGFPMDIGVKSGTAETGTRASHSTYGGFAPFDNPQIAAFVIVPHGDNRHLRSPAGHILRAVFEEYYGLNPQTASDTASDFSIQ
ncbi:MAG: penicillin-binding transpeptidase domain-containing protein, partial [Defluviitaleaceae bacterium]|nr:penicillin-binding transpeptidase domain-containing protein [Defluviitaleaceae bacterium]